MVLNTRTLILGGGGAAILAALLYVTFRTEPVPVDLYTLERGPMVVTVDADGQTRIKDIFEVAAPITGTALRSPVDVGDPVAAGDTLVAVVEPITPSLLDPRTRLQQQAALSEAEAALHVARTELNTALEDQTLAKTTYDRIKTLKERNVASQSQLDDATQRLAITRAGVEAAHARIDMSVSALQRVRAGLLAPDDPDVAPDNCCVELRSPADGVVLSVASISERPVVAGAPLVSVGDPANLELVADLLSSDAARLPVAAQARVERWGGAEALMAELDRIEPVARTKVSALGIEEQRVDVIFALTTPEAQRPSLGEGFAVFMRIELWRDADVLAVPLSALFRDTDGWAVFVVNGNVAERREITLGQRNGRLAQVLSGLEAGERVITHPSDDISDGSTVVER